MDASDVLDRWTTMWNGTSELVDELCGDDFTIYFGADPDGTGQHQMDGVVGAARFKVFLLDYWRRNPGTTFHTVRILATSDGHRSGFAVLLWDATLSDQHRVGGTDTFVFGSDGRIERVYSVTGQRPIIV